MTRHCLKDKVVYIAAPYRSSSNAIQQYRYVQSCMVAARLMEAGVCTFSPLANTIPVAVYANLHLPAGLYLQYDTTILRKCNELLVLAMDGWDVSEGVQYEIQCAKKMGIPIIVVPESAFGELPYIKPEYELTEEHTTMFPYKSTADV